jgi:hypothetical protein
MPPAPARLAPPATGRRPSLLPVLALAGLLLGATAARGQFRPALFLEEQTMSDVPAYTAALARANALMRANHGVPLFLRAYAAPALAGGSGETFSLSPAASFEALLKNTQTFATDSALADVRREIAAATAPGRGTYLKAVRFDGTNAPGWLWNSRVKTDDEPALLARVAELAALLLAAAPDRGPPSVNVFRVVAGHTGYTHLVSLNTAGPADLAACLDALAAAAFTLEFSRGTGARAEIVRSGVYRELGP